MNERLIFEYSPAYVIVCLLVAAGYAFLLYTTKHPWSKQLNWVMFSMRLLLVFFLAFLLLGPIVEQINNLFEKPLIVFLQDDSGSVKEATDSASLKTTQQQVTNIIKALETNGYEVKTTNLHGEDITTPSYKATTSDLNTALKKIANRYEGRNIANVVLVSDGIYNTGLSPLYASYNFPIQTIGVGDTAQRIDLSLKNIAYNKIAYQGNKFPLRAEVLINGITNQAIVVTLTHHGKVIDKQTKNSGSNQLLSYDFQAEANEQGIQKFDLQIDIKPGENNIKNNHASVFVEVVEGKKKILVVAPSPHPDIKVLREVVDKNSNYEFLLHIPGLSEQPLSVLEPNKTDLVIFHQSPDYRGKTRELFQKFANTKTSILLILGPQTDLAQVSKMNMPLKFITTPREYDDVTPAINASFPNFTLSAENNSIIADYPPVSVHYGKIQIPLTAVPLIYQRVGSITTDKPLLAIEDKDAHKIGILLGEGIWRWRLNEFDRTEKTIAFDDLFSKLIQYLSSTDDKRKFRSYPVRQEFSDTEPVIFESQVYNDIFEPIYGNTINLEVVSDTGKKSAYTYTLSAGNARYQIGGLKEGVYHYKAKTTINNKPEEVKGEFVVVEQQGELQNLTADFDLLRKLSANTGGKFYSATTLPALAVNLQTVEAKSIIHTEEHFNSIINLKWVFWLFLILISAEWFIRKYFGSY